MEQKMNRALRACLERSSGNPICSIHDQGAGGNGTKLFFFHDLHRDDNTKVKHIESYYHFSGNVLKELSEPAGAVIYCSRFKVIGHSYKHAHSVILPLSYHSYCFPLLSVFVS